MIQSQVNYCQKADQVVQSYSHPSFDIQFSEQIFF